jgi:hypothetical protein
LVQAPPRDVVEKWVVYLRGGPSALNDFTKDPAAYVARRANYETVARGSSIQTYLNGVQHINGLVVSGLRLSAAECQHHIVDDAFLRQLQGYKKDDPFDPHHAFDPVEVLPRLYQAICAKKWPLSKKLKSWTQFLTMFNFIARSSCVTEYCPLIEKIELPSKTAAKLWSAREGGMPQYLRLVLDDRKNTESWKGLVDPSEGKGFLIYRNHLNAMVDPVYVDRGLVYCTDCYALHETRR